MKFIIILLTLLENERSTREKGFSLFQKHVNKSKEEIFEVKIRYRDTIEKKEIQGDQEKWKKEDLKKLNETEKKDFPAHN